MSGASHSAAFDRANSSAKLLRVRIWTCHWPWSQLKTHRFQCKNHRLEKANDGTGFKKPYKLTINYKHKHHTTWYFFSKISNEHFKVPCFTPPGHRVLAVALDNWRYPGCQSNPDWRLWKETVGLLAEPHHHRVRRVRLAQLACDSAAKDGWSRPASPTRRELLSRWWFGQFFSKKQSTKKNKKQKVSCHHASAAWCQRFSCTITSRTTDYSIIDDL